MGGRDRRGWTRFVTQGIDDLSQGCLMTLEAVLRNLQPASKFLVFVLESLVASAFRGRELVQLGPEVVEFGALSCSKGLLRQTVADFPGRVSDGQRLRAVSVNEIPSFRGRGRFHAGQVILGRTVLAFRLSRHDQEDTVATVKV